MDKEEMFKQATINLVSVKCKDDIEGCLRTIALGGAENVVNAVMALACACFVKGSVEVLGK